MAWYMCARCEQRVLRAPRGERTRCEFCAKIPKRKVRRPSEEAGPWQENAIRILEDRPQDEPRMGTANCCWTVFNKQEGVIKAFSAGKAPDKAKKRAKAWQKKNRPRGTRIVYVCIAPRD